MCEGAEGCARQLQSMHVPAQVARVGAPLHVLLQDVREGAPAQHMNSQKMSWHLRVCVVFGGRGACIRRVRLPLSCNLLVAGVRTPKCKQPTPRAATACCSIPGARLSYCGPVQVQLCPSIKCIPLHLHSYPTAVASSPSAVMPATANHTGGLGTCIGCASCACCMLQVCRRKSVQQFIRAGAADVLGLSSYNIVLHVCNAPRHGAHCMRHVPLALLQYMYT